MKLLVVDDSRAARMLIKSILLDYDPEMEIEEAENGALAVDKYGQFGPDLVILDLTMPVMDGFTALEKIRQQDPEALVVILTADVQIKSVERCMDAGAFKVLKKLPDKKVVYALLDELTSRDSGVS